AVGAREGEGIERIKRHRGARSAIRSATFALADAQNVIAREHGFADWPTFAQCIEAHARPDSRVAQFEAAADAVAAGDAATLASLLRDDPQLVRERSMREHHAPLLHYVAANGVEGYRQKTPSNAVAIARLLLEAGAEADAFADMYEGRYTTLSMLVSSCHPAKAGVQVALVDTLVDYGAAVDGVAGEGRDSEPAERELPLMTALAFGYPAAAEALVRRGAAVDNIVAAAGLGRIDLVKAFLG